MKRTPVLTSGEFLAKSLPLFDNVSQHPEILDLGLYKKAGDVIFSKKPPLFRVNDMSKQGPGFFC